MTEWTTPADVERKLRRHWDNGSVLAAYAEGRSWEPLSVPLRGPTARQIGDDLEHVQRWITSWKRAEGRLGRLEYRRVGGRLVGANDIPARLWIDGYSQLWSALETTTEARRFAELVEMTRSSSPPLVEWMLRKPTKVLELEAQWSKLLGTVRWIDANLDGSQYIRQVDVPGVDTKFIERHRSVLATLLDLQLDPQRIARDRPRSDFVGRYGFRCRPRYVRLRALGRDQRLIGEFREANVRLNELAESAPASSTVHVIENDITYLAFPPVDDAIAIFGNGYAASILEELDWLIDRELVYWGDIDTHGFAILDRVRQRFPHTRSMLMDRGTLLDHQQHWSTEESQRVAALQHLDTDEADLYRDLIEGALGNNIRLEQERVSYAAIEHALMAVCG